MKLPLGNVTLFELEIVGELGQHASLRSLSRSRRIAAPHLSKVLARVERKLGMSLLQRSPKGFFLTPDGLRAVKLAREILEVTERLERRAPDLEEAPMPIVSIAAARFVASTLVAPTLEELRMRNARMRFRVLDMAPDDVATAAVSLAAEVAVTVGEASLPRTWSSVQLGSLTWALYASRRHPLPARVRSRSALEFPFVVPTYWKAGGFENGNDYCPIPWSDRILGDESSSILTAVEIVRRSPEQLVFAPRLVMEAGVASGELREITVSDWATVKKPLFFSVHVDRVTAPLQKSIAQGLAARLR